MIHEVDESLRMLMRQEALGGSEVDILFEAPTKEWAGRRNNPTIDVYLYDIREDTGFRQNGIIERRDAQGRVTSRGRPPRFYKLRYLVTAWTQRPEDEHRLLSACLSAFLRHDVIPRQHLIGTLADMEEAVSVTIAIPPPQERSISDIWSAMGGELKPSLDLVVSAPMDTAVSYHVGPPVLEVPTIGLRRADDDVAQRNRIGADGRLLEKVGPAEAEADGDEAAAAASGGGGGRRRKRGAGAEEPAEAVPAAKADAVGAAAAGPDGEPLQDEAFYTSEDHLGRVMRIQGIPRKRS